MLNNREISELFEVQLNTLYNWQKTKPKLYKYLKHADYNNNRNKEINILLDEYTIDINHNFNINEVQYLINCSFEIVSMENIKDFDIIFIQNEYKDIPNNGKYILNIYDKIKLLNIIEKYIFYKKIYRFKENKTIKSNEIKEYFKEFLNSN